MSEQKQCPKCKQFKVMSHRKTAIIIGIMSLSFGVLLIWIPFVGLPLAIVGLLLLIAGMVPFTGAGKHFMCNNCRYNWKE